MTDKIDSFTGEHFFLSNFYPSPIKVTDGLVAPTAEHLFQSLKTTDLADMLAVLAAPTPGEAKKLGRRVALSPDWESTKDQFMQAVLTLKFDEHPELRDKLLATGDAELVEGNTWGDKYWGVCDGEGENKLGLLLMKLRASWRMAVA